MFSPAKKLILILIVTLIASYISLPRELTLFGKKFIRGDLDLSLGSFRLKKNLDISLGLDLAGGSHLVFEAELEEIGIDKKKAALDSLKAVMERRVNLFGVSEPTVQTSSFAGRERVIIELPGVKDTQKAIDLIGKTAQLVFAEEVEGDTLGVKPTDLTGADLKSAEVTFDQNTGKPAVSLEFSSEGAQKFGVITERNIGKPLYILLDQETVSAPLVQEKIVGSAQITGDFTLEEARNLAIQLNAGALPVGVHLIEQRVVGSTLGAESIEKSIKAGVVGIFFVLLFMILTYGRLGLVADLALISFGALTLALYKLIPVVLTLPGIAGFMLSVGMAVDANILIFERFKEEKDKHAVRDALEISFGRAWDSIRDANIATLATAFLLANPLDWDFLHTSGPVRGFAITLALGIGISLFTGIVVSRNLLRVFIRQ